jgi:hypothetical protein
MKKTIIAIAAAGLLGGAATTLTPAPAHAVFPIFLGLVKPDPNFHAVNPYDTKPRMHRRHHRKPVDHRD